MFECAYCENSIEEDSFFCDQCGQQILLCATCLKPKKGKWCEDDGGELFPAIAKEDTAFNKKIHNQSVDKEHMSSSPLSQPSTVVPRLQLVNKNLNLHLELADGDILGRKEGSHSSKIESFSQVSRRHLLFRYDRFSGWEFKDIGSANGTKHNTINTSWEDTPKSIPQAAVQLKDRDYILVANIEFLVLIDDMSQNNFTHRI